METARCNSINKKKYLNNRKVTNHTPSPTSQDGFHTVIIIKMLQGVKLNFEFNHHNNNIS